MPCDDTTMSSILSLSALAGDVMSKAEAPRSVRTLSLSADVMRSCCWSTVLLLDGAGPSISAFSGVGVEVWSILESGRGDAELDLDTISTSSAMAVDAAVAVGAAAAEDPASALAESGDDASLSMCISSNPSLSGRQDEVDARNSSGHEELCDRGGNSGGGLLDGVGIVDNK